MGKVSPVFITGFERSGTTMLRRIVSMNPELTHNLWNEKRRLLKFESKEQAEIGFVSKNNSILAGEKIPYYNNTGFIIDYMNKMREYWPDTILLHIVRCKEDVIDSCFKTFERDKGITAKNYSNDVPIITNYMNKHKGYNINYDKIIAYPKEQVKFIYDIMGTDVPESHIEKVNSRRNPWRHGNRTMCGLKYKERIQ